MPHEQDPFPVQRMMLYRLSAILLVMLLVSPCAAGATAPDLADKFRTEQAGQPLPAIIFKDGSGREQRLANYAGRPILLNLWATWCVPCVKEMPSLDALQQLAGPENLLVLALAQDRQGDSKVPAFYQRYGIKNLGVYVDPTGQTMFTLKLRGLPTSILLDHQGQEIGRIEGEVDWSSPTTLAFLERLTGLKLASANH